MGTDKINERFSRRLARLEETGALVRVADWERYEAADRDFRRATLAKKLMPGRSTKAWQARAFLRLHAAAQALEAAR